MLNLKLTALLILILVKTASAQILDPIIASVKYKVTYSNGGNLLIDDICQLDIAKEKSYFYSLGVLESFKRFEKKAAQARASNTPLNLSESEFPSNLFKFNTIKDYVKDYSIVLEFVGEETLGYVKDTLSTRKWEILNEEMTIGTLQCRKAQAKSGNTIVTAWFCPAIAFRDGPLFYYGLPGLIVKLNSSQGWSVDLMSVSYSGPIKKPITIQPFRLVSSAQFIKAKKVVGSMLENGKMPNGSFSREN